MKQILCSTLLLFLGTVLYGQFDDYSILKLKRGSHLFGKIIDSDAKRLVLETNLLDTFFIPKKSIRKQYLISENYDNRGDLPVLVRGRYSTLFVGFGNGVQETNFQHNPFIFFPGTIQNLPLVHYSVLTALKAQGSVGYQFNRYFGLGVGASLEFYFAELPERFIDFNPSSGANLLPYIQGTFNYPIKKGFGHKDFYLIVNAFLHTEIIAGISFIRPKGRFNIGIGFFKDYEDFQSKSYFSVQGGLQF